MQVLSFSTQLSFLPSVTPSPQRVLELVFTKSLVGSLYTYAQTQTKFGVCVTSLSPCQTRETFPPSPTHIFPSSSPSPHIFYPSPSRTPPSSSSALLVLPKSACMLKVKRRGRAAPSTAAYPRRAERGQCTPRAPQRVRGSSHHIRDGPGTAQISSLSNRQPEPAVQLPSSSATVQSLAPATAWQMALAWAKFLSRAQPGAKDGGNGTSDSPQTEQPGLFFQPTRYVSEQQRTWAVGRPAGHGQG